MRLAFCVIALLILYFTAPTKDEAVPGARERLSPKIETAPPPYREPDPAEEPQRLPLALRRSPYARKSR